MCEWLGLQQFERKAFQKVGRWRFDIVSSVLPVDIHLDKGCRCQDLRCIWSKVLQMGIKYGCTLRSLITSNHLLIDRMDYFTCTDIWSHWSWIGQLFQMLHLWILEDWPLDSDFVPLGLARVALHGVSSLCASPICLWQSWGIGDSMSFDVTS